MQGGRRLVFNFSGLLVFRLERSLGLLIKAFDLGVNIEISSFGSPAQQVVTREGSLQHGVLVVLVVSHHLCDGFRVDAHFVSCEFGQLTVCLKMVYRQGSSFRWNSSLPCSRSVG